MLHPYHKLKKHQKTDSPAIKIFNSFVIVFAAVSPLALLPQIYLIYSSKEAEGVSAITWGATAVGACIWLLYGIVHKEKAIVMNSSIGFLFAASICVGALLFGR